MGNVYVLAFGAYLLFSIADACIKAVGGRLGVFEIAFAMNVFAIVVILALRRGGESWRGFWRTPQPLRVHGRAWCGLISGFCSVYAFSMVPLVDAYALIFLAPFFVTLMSMLLLGEQVERVRWIAVALGFAGVLLAVRPGFRELEAGHLAAVTSGLATGTAIVILRSLDASVKKTNVLGTQFSYALVASTLMLAVVGYQVPSFQELLILVLAGVTMGLGQVALLAAARAGRASQVAPAVYSPLLWALVIGALFFGEFPDFVAILGMACIVCAGLLNVLPAKAAFWRRRAHAAPKV